MNPTTKFLHYAQVAIPFLPAFLGLVILGLGADIITDTKKHFAIAEDAYYDQGAYVWYHAKNGMDYLPRNMPYTRPALLVAVGVICMVGNVAIAGILIKRQKTNAHVGGRKYITSAPTTVILGLDTVLAVLALVSMIYSWLPTFDPYDAHKVPSNVGHYDEDGDLEFVWNSPMTFDPVNWFCALHSFLFHDSRIAGKCKQGNSLIDLMIPLFLLQALALGLHFWSFRRAKKVERELAAKAANNTELPKL